MIGTRDLARASLWHRIAASEKAGIPITTSIARAVDGGGEGRVLAPAQAALHRGEDLATAMTAATELSTLEQRLIGAGARSGHLPEALDALARHLEERARTKRRLAGGLAYPLFLLHAASVLPALPTLITDGAAGFLKAAFTPILILWGAVAIVVLVGRAARSAAPIAWDGLLLHVPLLGGVLRRESLATALHALRLLYQSGVPLLEAVEVAAGACPNAAVAARLLVVRRRMIDDGSTLAQALVGEPYFPREVLDLVTSGEQAGQLDAMLARASDRLVEDAKVARTAGLAVASGMAFLLAAGVVAFKVISFWADYANKLGSAGGF
jgi:general secretion pathway protein F